MTSADRLQAIEEKFSDIELLLKQLGRRIAGLAEDIRIAARSPRRVGKKR
jgi:hypothetical protein